MTADVAKLETLLGPAVRSMGCELWGCELHRHKGSAHLRVYIDRPEGVKVEDCERVSHQVSGVLEVEEPIGGDYTLEVSSPGLDRPLLKAEHFQRYAGAQVRVRLRRPIEGRRRFSARLRGLEAGQVLIEEAQQGYSIPLDAIGRARLVPEV